MKLKWSYTRSVSANYGTGLPSSDTAFFMLGGDNWYEKFYGYLKNIRFFDSSVLPTTLHACHGNDKCATCDVKGVCTSCRTTFDTLNTG